VLSPAADLSVSVDNGLEQVTPGDSVTWDVVVANNGPSSVRGVFVEDLIPAALFDATASCTAEPSAGVLAGPLAVDSRVVPARLAFAADGRRAFAVGGERLEVLRRDPLTGNLVSDQLLQQAVAGVTGIRGASDVVASADGRYVYVAGTQSDAIALFGPSEEGDELVFVAAIRDGEAGIEGIGGVSRLLLSPDGSRLYAAGSEDQALAVFAIDAASGRLSPVQVLLQGQNGVNGLAGLTDLAWAGDGDVLLAVAGANQSLAAFERNAFSGELTFADVLFNDDLLGTAAAGALLEPAAVIEAADEILVAAAGDDRIGRFIVEPAAAGVPGARVTLGALGSIDADTLGRALTLPFDLEFVEDQRRLYVATAEGVLLVNLLAEQPEVIEVYGASDFNTLTGLSALALGPSLRQLYTAGISDGAEIGVWARERGSRCPLTARGGLGRQAVDIVAGGRLVYQVNGQVQPNASDQISYTVSVVNPVEGQELNPADNSATDADALIPAPDLEVVKQLASEPPVIAGLPVQWRIDMANLGLSDAARAPLLDALPVFPADGGGVLTNSGAWSCQANRPLAPLDTADVPAAATAIAIGPQGRYVYAAAEGADALLIFALEVDGTLGAPTVIAEGATLPGGTVEGMAGISDLTVSDDGLQVYVSAAAGNSVLVFARPVLDAALDLAQTFTTVLGDGSSTPGLRGARAITLSADQRRVLVAGQVSDAIAIFDRDPRTGRLEFNERVRDGIGTIVPESNVIQGVSALHTTADGELYAIAAGSRAFTRFSINPTSGAATFENVWRAGDAGLPSLAGIRAIEAAPGDTQLYLLADIGVIVLERTADGTLVFQGVFDALGDPAATTALEIDAAGSRAYVLAQTDQGAVVHVLRRDWNDGSLEFWFSQAVSAGAARALVQSPAENRLYASVADGVLARFDEQALSRCRIEAGQADAVATEVDLGARGWSVFDLSATVHPSARGELVNTAEAGVSDGEDPNVDNNLSTVAMPIEVVSDIAVTKTGPAEAVAGTRIEYLLTVTNAGPSDALGIRLRDPAVLAGLTWTCVASEGSSCPGAGSGAIDFAADVLVGGRLDIVLETTIDPALIGRIANVAVLEPEPGSTDPTPDDQRAEVITNIIAVADVAVTKATLTDAVIAGAPVEYRIEAINNGPSDAAGVRPVDAFPAALAEAGWICTASGGAGCPAAGSGSIDMTLLLPVGGAVEFRVSGLLGADQVGELVNRIDATVELPATDPDETNNSAEVRDTIELRSDLAVELRAPINPFDPAGPNDLPLELVVGNAGPSNARAVDVVIDFSSPVRLTSSGCVQPASTRVRCTLAELAAGDIRMLNLALDGLPGAPGSLVVDALVSAAAEDPELLDNAASLVVELRSGIDLKVAIDNPQNQMGPDEQVIYDIVIDNFGSVAAIGADVAVDVPVELLEAEWTCAAEGGASCTAAGMGSIADVVTVPSGGRLVYSLSVRVDPTLDTDVPQTVAVTATVDSAPPEDDFNRLNNVAVDENGIGSLIFEDGFEALEPTAQRTLAPTDPACFALALDTVAPDPAAASVLEARSSSGRRLFWVDTARLGGRDWVRLATLEARSAENSGWHELPSGAAVAVRVRHGTAALDIDNQTAWQAPSGLPEPVARIRTSAASTSASCGASGQPEMLESSQ
ncbi:MAG: beta-propeller fold lactonase family protein, partial [Wenzhouxiangellaceae bacterium]|nr:beta-propeller fold lactonase family protein [Wenzhouxiangellaceae bacterium]